MMSNRGVTLIEVLIAVAVFAIVIAISSAVTASLSLNRISGDRLKANQAAQSFFETATEYWRTSANFGKADATTFPVPAELTGYTWSLTISEINMASATFAASSSVTWTATSKPTFTPSATASLMNLSLTYTPPGGAASFVNGTEVAKR